MYSTFWALRCIIFTSTLWRPSQGLSLPDQHWYVGHTACKMNSYLLIEFNSFGDCSTQWEDDYIAPSNVNIGNMVRLNILVLSRTTNESMIQAAFSEFRQMSSPSLQFRRGKPYTGILRSASLPSRKPSSTVSMGQVFSHCV